MATTEFDLLMIKRCVLKVNMHCPGCVQRVRKLLQKIEGVYIVNIVAEKHKVKVIGTVDSEALIHKLAKSGKHAELWSTNLNQTEPNRHHIGNNQPQGHYQHNNLDTYSPNDVLRPTFLDNKEGNELDSEYNMGTEPVMGQSDYELILARDFENMRVRGGGNGYGLGNREFGVFQDHLAEPLAYEGDHLSSMMNGSVREYAHKYLLNAQRTNHRSIVDPSDQFYYLRPQPMSFVSNHIPFNNDSVSVFGSEVLPNYD